MQTRCSMAHGARLGVAVLQRNAVRELRHRLADAAVAAAQLDVVQQRHIEDDAKKDGELRDEAVRRVEVAQVQQR